jgi:hypothetical protein
MAEVRLRNVDENAIAVIRELAKRNSQSMEHLIKESLYALADREKQSLLTELRHYRRTSGREVDILPDSTAGIREERDARW